MKIIFSIALFTFKEGIRHRILYGAFAFSCFLIFLSVLASGMFMRDISKILLDFCLSAVSLGGLLIPFFVAINLLAGDIESRTIYSILSLPISRGKYILGKYLGLSALIFLVMGLLTLATFVAIQAGILVYSQAYFTTVSPAAILQAVLSGVLCNMVLLACVFLWSSLTTSTFLATMLTLSTYTIGQTIEEIVRFMAVQTPGVEFSPFFKKTIILLLYIFPNLAAFDLKQLAAHGHLTTLVHSVYLCSYGLAYITVAMTLSIMLFMRRDIS